MALSERSNFSWGFSLLPARSMSINSGLSIASVFPSGVSTSIISSAGLAEAGFTPGGMLSASVKLIGRAALSG